MPLGKREVERRRKGKEREKGEEGGGLLQKILQCPQKLPTKSA